MRYLCALLLLCACYGDETLSGYAPINTPFHLIQMDGAPVAPPITLQLERGGKITGNGPCNGYFSHITAPYPWFELDGVAATRRACPDLATETRYFTVLNTMALAEYAGGTLILSNDAGQSLTFTTRE